MAKCLLHVLYVATDRRALSQLLLLQHALYHNIILEMHFLPQLSDFVPLRNGFHSFRAQTA